MFGLAAVAAVAAMAFVGATSASATSTQLCTEHNVGSGLACAGGKEVLKVHQVLPAGAVGKLLAAINVLCLGFLVEADVTNAAGVAGALVTTGPQKITSITQTFTGCGTGALHNNCEVSTVQQPVFNLLKSGLDAGVLSAVSGQVRLVCPNLGLNCLYDVEGMEFSAGGGHLTAEETPVTELGGKFFCPDEGKLDALVESLVKPAPYILG
jgi:hypothetical protein